MCAELAAGRQHRKHRAMDGWNRIQQLDGLRAQGARRWKKVVVPFEIKALPAALEERVETPVVVLRSRPNEAFVEQHHRLVADRLPIVAQLCQFREAVDRDHRLVGNRRARVHQHIIGSKIGRVIAELAAYLETFTAAQMHVHGACDENVKANKLWREKLLQHPAVRPPWHPSPSPISPCPASDDKAPKCTFWPCTTSIFPSQRRCDE